MWATCQGKQITMCIAIIISLSVDEQRWVCGCVCRGDVVLWAASMRVPTSLFWEEDLPVLSCISCVTAPQALSTLNDCIIAEPFSWALAGSSCYLTRQWGVLERGRQVAPERAGSIPSSIHEYLWDLGRLPYLCESSFSYLQTRMIILISVKCIHI